MKFHRRWSQQNRFIDNPQQSQSRQNCHHVSFTDGGNRKWEGVFLEQWNVSKCCTRKSRQWICDNYTYPVSENLYFINFESGTKWLFFRHISFTSAKFMQPRSPLSGPIWHNVLVKSRHIPFLVLGVLDLRKIFSDLTNITVIVGMFASWYAPRCHCDNCTEDLSIAGITIVKITNI